MTVQELLSYIDQHKEESIEFLQKLISFDSSFQEQGKYGNENDIQQWLDQTLSDWGFSTRLFEPDNLKIESLPDYNPGHDYKNRPNLVAICQGAGNGRSILLNGHIDTVPLDDISKWQNHPLHGDIVDGKIVGRGACDMKAGVAAMILATKYIHECGCEHQGDIILESVVDEEGGGNGTLACVAEGYTADAAIVTEPTGLQIFCASRGVLLLEVTVYGKPSHACYKWNGVNAIEKAYKIIDSLQELERKWLVSKYNPLLPSPTITVGQIEGGISAATVPGACTLRFDIKYLPTEMDKNDNSIEVNSEQVKSEIESCIMTACQGDEWLKDNPVKLNWYLSVKPHYIDPQNPLIDVFSQACDELIGKHTLSGLPSGADARHLQNTGHIQTIIFGPGDMHNAHSINEFVGIDQFINSIKILAKVILNWTNKGDTK